MPESDWPSDFVTIRVSKIDGVAGNFGETTAWSERLGPTAFADAAATT